MFSSAPLRALRHAGDRMRRATRSLAVSALAATSLLGACADNGVGPSGQSAQLVLSASFQTTAGSNEEVRIATSYLLQNGGYSPLSTQSIRLTGTAQAVPVGVDLASCLANGQRGALPGTSIGADECVVLIEIQLLIDGLPVDRQYVGPLSLRPGVTTTVPSTIQLNDVAEVRINAPAENVVGTGQPLRLELARPMTLSTSVLDRQQRPVTGRAATWTSSNPNVASVSAAGVVTGVAVGSTRITADVGGRMNFVDVRVVPPPAALTVVSAGQSGTGTLTSSPAGISCVINGTGAAGTCAYTFPGDVDVVLTATPASGSELIGWSGDCSGTQGAACTVSMNQARNVGVVFRALRTLNISAAGTGFGTVNSDLGGITCYAAQGGVSGTCSNVFYEGTVVTLQAIPSGQSTFGGWTGDCAGVNAPVCQITMNAARSVTARFDAPVPISIAGIGQGSGTVSSSPIGIACTLNGAAGLGACSALFTEGSTITLTATAANRNSFRGWSGCTTTSGATCTVQVTSPGKAISVQFDPPAVLTVVPSGTGDGQVFGGTAISCARSNGQTSGTCSNTLANGSSITLTAIPDSYSTFTGWTGACSGNGACTLTMDQAKTVGAVFTRRQVALTLSLQGPGFGSVRVNDNYTCTLQEGESEKECQTFVDLNRMVTLTALPGTEQTFGAFSGACLSSSQSCTFTANSPAVVTATFGTPTVTLNVTAPSNATGAGMVSASGMEIDCSLVGASSPAPQDCKATASVEDLQGTLTLYATPDGASTFGGWGGACASAGTSPTCVLTSIEGNIEVTAWFVAVPTVQVSVTLNGLGMGSLTASGSSWTRTCERSSGGNDPTHCTWLIPINQSFDIYVSDGYGYFTSTSGQLCYNVSSSCSYPSGISSGNSVSAWFDPYSPIRQKK